MKKLITIFLLLAFLAFVNTGCSDECEGKNPTVQLVNYGTGKADVQVKTSGGNTENINNIMPGNSSERRSFDEGEIVFTITIQGISKPVVYRLDVFTCNEYTVTINSDNTVSSSGMKLDKGLL